MATSEADTTATPGPEKSADGVRLARPVLWWATLGAVLLVFQLVVWTRWITSGTATPTPVGADVQPTWMTVVQTITQVVMPILLVITGYLFVVKPWRRTGRISRDGLFWIAWLLLWFWDPLLNYFQTIAVYNPNMVNFGSWTAGVFPGWSAPRGNFHAEPILMMPAVYAAVLFPAVIWGCSLMAKLKGRGVSTPMNILISWIVMTVVSTILEGLIFMPLGFYTIPGADPAWSINDGTYYQFPLYHAMFFGAWCAGATALRFFTNDKDQTLVERGIDRVPVKPRTQTLLRFLALLAATIVLNGLYFLPIQYFAIKSGPWPQAVTETSYFRSNICGEGTGYACPGPAIPIPRENSLHVTPEGTLTGAGAHGGE